ncbi:MAG: Nramp family divalent metal transporter [Candidatus Magasanikbacteria bacterium]|nr:Nramp family divalent metal transporter [Candidatus Magasanikbacteria bacterium]
MFKARWQKLVLAMSVVGPAIIAGTANNDAGGISTYSYVGSRFGYAMLWVLLVNFITLACTQEIGIKLGVYTGKGLAALIREQFKIGWTLFALLTLFAANVAVTASEFSGIAAAFEMFGVSKWMVVPIFVVLVWVLLYKGSFKRIERFFLFISLFLLVYIVSAVLAHPNWANVLKESVAVRMPTDFPFLIALLGVMGTTITPWGQFFIQSYVVDKGADPKDYKIQRLEVYFSAFFTCLIAAMIMITTKEVLFDRGIVVDSAATAASALAPVLGSLAEIIFGVGFFFASLLGAFILPLTTSYSICEALGFEHGMDTTWKEAKAFYGIMAAIIVLSAVLTLQPWFSLFQVMIFAQVINGILLPIILIFILILLIKGKQFGLPESSKLGKIFYFVITGETIVRLIIVSVLLVLLTLFPSLVDWFKQWAVSF